MGVLSDPTIPINISKFNADNISTRRLAKQSKCLGALRPAVPTLTDIPKTQLTSVISPNGH